MVEKPSLFLHFNQTSIPQLTLFLIYDGLTRNDSIGDSISAYDVYCSTSRLRLTSQPCHTLALPDIATQMGTEFTEF